MRITDKPQNPNINPTPINRVRKNTVKVAKTPEEQMVILVDKGREVLAKMVVEFVPEEGRITRPVSVSFDVPATNNHTIISVEESAVKSPKKKHPLRDLIVGVRHKQRDRLTSNIVLNQKQKKEIIDYLKNNQSQEQLIKSIRQLSDKTDEYYNSL